MACSLDVHFPTSITTAGTDAVWAEEDREGPPPDGLPFDPIDSLWYCVSTAIESCTGLAIENVTLYGGDEPLVRRFLLSSCSLSLRG